jgi:glycosyltransferase involved in cell wall biosynthesis
MGHAVRVIGPAPAGWRSLAAPTYPDIRFEFFARPRLKKIIAAFAPDVIHIATEGPLGLAARNLCLSRRRPFTTSYHTRFPEYLAARVPYGLKKAVERIAYALLRRFHAPASAVMVATDSIEKELKARRFRRLVRWSRGVDTGLFRPYGETVPAYEGLKRPVLLYVGRVAVEKNLPAFLDLKTGGSKVVIGDGPDLAALRAAHPEVLFLGRMEGETLARHYAAADLFVFPSTTDTFGLVLLEAAAAGLRVASVPAPGPADIFAAPAARAFAVLNKNLQKAVEEALALPDDPAGPGRFAEGFSWASCARQFCDNLQPPTDEAIKKIARRGAWLGRWWRHIRPG